MNTRLLAIPLLVLTLASCDKAKTLADKVASAAKDQIARRTGGEAANTVDPELEKLVDRTDEGAIFRKDLPFPTRLEVNLTSRSHGTTRLSKNSAIENRADILKGLMVSTSKLERSGDHVRYTQGEISLTDPSAEGPDGKAKPIANNPLASIAAPPRTFSRKDGVWAPDSNSGFAGAALAKDLSPVFDLLLQENGLAPRPMWFGKRRIKIGEEITLSGKSLPMLISGNAKGTLHLKLESFEPFAGHPCGVFTLSGDYTRKQFPSFDGTFTDEDVTIQSGKVWLSLIHPLILKWDIDVVQTFERGNKGGPGLHGQGNAQITTTSDWKALPN